MGLAITQRLIELMGSQITVDSTPGQGSRFQFTLELSTADPALIQPRQLQQPILELATNQPTYRILIVDDQAENRLLLLKWLSKVGFAVREAVNGLECIQHWQDWQPDLILMDIRMPDMDGYETTKTLRTLEQARAELTTTPLYNLADPPNSPVSTESECTSGSPASSVSRRRTVIIALTAQAFVEHNTQAIAAGCDTYLVKPFSFPVLLETIAHYLGATYRYATRPQMQPNYPADHPLTSADLAVMPPAWLAELHLAARCCDEQAVTDLINKIPPTHKSLAMGLTYLNYHFAFEQMMNLTEPLVR